MKLTIDEIKKMASAWNQVQEAKKKKMDPVGKADADIDNDGDVDSSDEYLHKRRKAIGKAIKGKQTETEVQESVELSENDGYYAYQDAKDKYHKDNPGSDFERAPEHHKQKYIHPEMKKRGYVKSGSRWVKESVELDEISKTKMGQYIKRAHSDKETQKKRADVFNKKGMYADKDKDMYNAFSKADRARKKADNRTKFIGKAVDKLTKEAKDHGNMNNGSPRGEGLSPSAKKELARTTPMNPATDEPMVNKKTFDAIRASGKKAPMRSNDNAAGEKNIKPSATQVKEDMDKIHTVDIDHMGGRDPDAKMHNITLKKTKATDYSHNASGKKKDLQKYLAKHYGSAEDAKEIHPEIH